jgi:eukaryotic-like serine/threonine-protein kinase
MSTAVPAPLGAVSHYTLLERLEPSGPGELYRARDTKLGRTVTVRLLPPGYPSGPIERQWLFDSANAVIALSHPNITLLYDAGEYEGRAFLVFEFIKGQALRAEMAGRPMNVRRAVELAIQMADGVAEAHGAGFFHGGLSPDSIMITARGHAKIPAFELASRSGFEQDGRGVRLRDYDSPEEARGQAPDDRSDIYSVGAVLYEMLTTKRPPHKGAAAPSASNPHVPPELDEVVLRAVAPNPDLRIQSAATFAAELRSLAAILDVRGVPDEEHEHGESRGTGRMLLIAGGILAALAVLGYLIAG